MRHMPNALATALAIAAIPIPSDNGSTPAFVGAPATPHAVSAPAPPRHPFMAPNERSNLHDDAYQTDTYRGIGPLGQRTRTITSTLFTADCGSVTFDTQGRIVTVCVGVAGPTLRMLDPTDARHARRAAAAAARPAHPRRTCSRASAAAATSTSTTRTARSSRRRRATSRCSPRRPAPGFTMVRDIDLSGVIPDGESIISALPDWKGRIWFASSGGVVGYVGAAGRIVSRSLGEPIGNSFAVDEHGGVYIVSDAALYRFEARGGAGQDDLARALREHRHRQAGAEREGLGHDADADGQAPTCRSPTTRTR